MASQRQLRMPTSLIHRHATLRPSGPLAAHFTRQHQSRFLKKGDNSLLFSFRMPYTTVACSIQGGLWQYGRGEFQIRPGIPASIPEPKQTSLTSGRKTRTGDSSDFGLDPVADPDRPRSAGAERSQSCQNGSQYSVKVSVEGARTNPTRAVVGPKGARTKPTTLFRRAESARTKPTRSGERATTAR